MFLDLKIDNVNSNKSESLYNLSQCIAAKSQSRLFLMASNATSMLELLGLSHREFPIISNKFQRLIHAWWVLMRLIGVYYCHGEVSELYYACILMTY
jgi:hypothetical protein